jgi:hypothetical protein
MMASTKESSRVLTFDLLRGYFLLSILLDHLHWYPNGLDWVAARGDLFVSAAEGFFLISGIVLGIVRGSKLIGAPFRQAASLLLRRGVQLYITSVVLVLFFTLIGWWFFMNNPGLKFEIAPPSTNIFDLIWRTITLQYVYGWADYLRLYAVFLFVSPLALWLLRKGKWYILLIVSVFVWMLFPSDPTIADRTQELLQLLSWQLIFFIGMTIGFHWKQLVGWWSKQALWLRRTVVFSILTLAAVTVLINIVIAFGPLFFDIRTIGMQPDIKYKWYMAFFDKERMPLQRLGLFMLWFWAAFYIFRRFETVIIERFGWLLLSFGTHSLYVYTVHAFIIFFVQLWLMPGNILTNFLVSIALIGLIRVMIHYKVLMKIIPR